MEHIIEIRYEGDGSLNESQKLSIVRYINRLLAGEKDAIISSNAFIRVICEKGSVAHLEFIGSNAALTKLISSKISITHLPF